MRRRKLSGWCDEVPGRLVTSGSEVAEEINCWLEVADGRRYQLSVYLDHWGSTVIDGLTCFVNEPYEDLDAALNHLRPLAELVCCEMRGSAESFHGHGTVRVTLHPPALYAERAVLSGGQV
jgi:hypothetical protein